MTFRVVDTRFRILKGGKIGLSLSIALIAGMSTLGSINANATDYFTDVNAGLSTNNYTSGSISLDLQTAGNTGIISVVRTENTSDDIVFKPTSWANSYYDVPSYSSDYYGDASNQQAFTLNKTIDSLVLNLTLASGANTGNISRNATTIYNTDATITVFASDTKNLIQTTSTAYITNLILQGNNTVSGTTDIGNGNIQLDGSATFTGSVTAGSIDVNTTNAVTFNSAVDLSAGTNTLSFNTTGNVILNSDLNGNVTTTANNQGTLTTTGLTQTITGNIGSSVSSDLNTLNIGSSTNSTNYSVTTINGNVYSNSTVLNNNGTTNSSELILSSGKNITSSISTADANMGILTLAGGTQTVTGQVGTNTERLAQINSGANGATSSFVNDVYAVNVTNTGTGTTTFQNDVVATNANVNAGTTTFQDNLTATTTTITTGTGNFNTVSGTTISDIVFSGTGTANLYADLRGNVTTTADNQGILTIIGSSTGKNQTIDGNIGSSSSLDLSTLNIGETGASTNYTVTTITGNVYANNTVLNNGTTNSSELILSSGKNIISNITTADNGKGILTLEGGIQTVTGTVGGTGALLKTVNAGANGATTTFSSDVYATNLNVTGTGEVDLNGNYTGTAITYNADGTVKLADNKNITSAVITNANDTGTLTLLGTSTVSGQVGDSTNKLKVVNAGANGATTTFSSDVYATNLNVTGTGEVDLNGNYTGTAITYNADGTVKLADNKNITSAVITNANDTGTLTLLGTSTVSGQVGDSTNKLKVVNAGANGATTTFSSDVYATNLNVTGTGEVDLNGNYTGTAITYNADGTVKLADNKNITSAVITNANDTGTLTLLGTSTVSGQVGDSTNKLKVVNAGANGEIGTFSSDVYATNLNVTGTGEVDLNGNYTGTAITYNADGTVKLADNKNITSAVITNANDTGTLTLLGTSTVSGQVGDSTNKLKVVNAGANGATTTFSSDVYATNLNVTGTGEVDLNGNYTGTAITYNADGTVKLADNKNITSAVITNANDTGTLTLLGTSTVSGQVGDSTNKLKVVNAGANGATTTFSSDVYATNLNVTGTGEVDLNGNYTGTAITYNADGTVKLADNKNITSAVITNANDTGTLTLLGTSTVSGQVGDSTNKLKVVNAGANGATTTFSSDVYATNLNVTGTGEVDLNGNYTGTAITYNADGTVKLADNKNITSAVITNANDTGTLTLLGTSTVSGQVGDSTNKLKVVNAGANGATTTFSSDVYATTTNIASGEIKFESDLTSNIIALTSDNGIVTFVGDTLGKTQNVTGNIGSLANSINTLNIGDGGIGNYSKTVINGNVYATNTVLNNETSNNSTLELADGSNITSTIKTSADGQGILTFVGDSIATGIIGTNTEKLAQINAGATGKTVTFNSSVNSDNLNFSGDGTVILADNANINAPVTTSTDNQGTLTFNGTSTVSGQVGTSGVKLKEINAGADGKVATFSSDVYATNLNVTGTGAVDLNGDTSSDIVFANDGTVNVADGKGILGSVQTLSNNTGILNYKGDGTISADIGSSITSGIKELNINTNNEQNTPDGVLVTVVGLARELYADVIALKNNATLTLADNANITNSGSDNILVTTDVTNTGKLTFQGTSNIIGEVGQSNKVLNTINAGATAETVTFNDMVYATNLKYSGNGKVVLNGDTASNTAEGMVGTIDLNNTTGTLAIGDNVNLSVDSSGIQFANANDAVLEFVGNTIVTGVLGGNTAGNSTFERIYAGADSSTVTFKNDVHVEESNDTTLHVSGTGTVNFEGDLIGDLIYDADGIVNVSDTKSIIVSTVPTAVRTQTDNTGTLNFLGTTTLYSDIGTETLKLKNVSFASEGTSSDTYTQTINKNIYAQNTYIGNSSNSVTVNVSDDIIFGGNLDLRDNTTLNVSDNDITVKDTLTMASNSKINFKVYTTDLSAGQAVENANSGSITASSLTMASDAKINIDYVGSWYGAGKYNLITASSVTGTYYGTEANGLVSDNSIIDSIVKIDGTNLTLFADRTGGGSYDADDLYIVKSEIGDHYSNGASQALAGYANEADRQGALADIIRNLEELQGGTTLSAAKKAEMIKTQKLLAPVANNSGIQSTIIASNLVLSTIKDRMSDLRGSTSMDFIPYSGYSSGDSGLDNSLWIKALASKATQSKVKDYDGYDSKSSGFVAGYDRTLKDGTTLGVAVAHSNTKVDQSDFRKGDTSETKSTQLTIYAEKEFGDAYVDGLLSYAKHSTDAIRTANSGQLSSTVSADQLSAKIELGYRVYFEDIATLTPFASVEYGTLNQKAYTEKGTTYQNDALKVDSVKMNKGTVGVGAKLTTNVNLGDALIIPELRLAVYNSIGDTNADIKAQYVGGGNQFITPTEDLNKTIYNAGAGLNTTLSDSSSLIFGVDYDRSKDGKFVGYSGNVSFKLSF